MDPSRLAAHLQERYGVEVDRVTEIESVHRIDRHDGPSWIARVFPRVRPVDAVEGDADILRFVEAHGFPAERCAIDSPVSVLDGQGVLITEFVPGPNGRPDERRATFSAMGDLLGRLHTLPVPGRAGCRPAGSWHHLSPAGGGRGQDVAALEALMADERFAPLRRELGAIDLLDDLPQALLHPDFVSANVILSGDGPVVIDWTGAGWGARICPLGMLLSTATRDELVDAVADGYRSHVQLEHEELERLAGAIRAFGLIIDCWTAVHHSQWFEHVVGGLAAKAARAEAIAARARAVLAAA